MFKPSTVVSCLKRFLSSITYITPIVSMCATRPAHLNLLYLSNVVTPLHGKELNSSISSLRDFLQSLLKSNSAPCSQMLTHFRLFPPLKDGRQISYNYSKKVKVKVKCTLVQALRLSTGRTAHRGSRGIALPFLDHGTRRGWGVSVTPRPLFTPGERPGTHCTGLYRRLSGHQGRYG